MVQGEVIKVSRKIKLLGVVVLGSLLLSGCMGRPDAKLQETGGPIGYMFDKIDDDNDGLVDIKEYRAFSEECFGKFDVNGDGKATFSEFNESRFAKSSPSMVQDIFINYDTNQDDVVTKEEMQSKEETNFTDMASADSDKISKNEMIAFLKIERFSMFDVNGCISLEKYQDAKSSFQKAVLASGYTVDRSSSHIKFKVNKFMFVGVTGEFSKFNGSVEIDENSNINTINATVDINSIDTGDEGRDAHLKEADYFHVESFPYITFNSSLIRKETIEAVVSIKGIQKTLTFKISDIEITDSKVMFKLTSEVDRHAFMLNGLMSEVISDNVDVYAYIVAYRNQ